MRNRKFLSAFLCAAMAATMLVGCGGKDTGTTTKKDSNKATQKASEDTDKGSETTEKIEIHHAYWHGTMKDYLTECEEIFEAENSNIDIVLDYYDWGDYWTKLEAAAAGGEVADVFQLNGPNNYKYADYGMLLPLDDYIADSDVDMSNYPEALNQIYNIDGIQYGIPVDWDTIGLWYNKELFDNAGVAYPTDDWTWEDLVAAAEKLTDEEAGIYGFAAGYADQGGFFNTVPAAGGYIVSEDGTKSGFDDEKTVKGLTIWEDILKAGYSPSQAKLNEVADTTLFMSGQIGMIMAGDWIITDLLAAEGFAGKFDAAMLPLIDGNRASCIHGKANCISSVTEHPDEAWAWVSYLASEEANKMLGESGAAIPSHVDCSGLFFDAYPDYNMSVFLRMAEECAVPYPTSRGWQEWADLIWNELVPAYSGEVTMAEACAKIAPQMDEILAQYN